MVVKNLVVFSIVRNSLHFFWLLDIYGWLNWFLLMEQFSNYNQITLFMYFGPWF
jgi:hypothetical protein